MHLTPHLRKASELGLALTAIATLILAGCGGGGSSTSSGGSSVATTTTTVTPYKGMFTNGSVVLKDANGNAVSLISGGSINVSGVASVTYPSNVAYPLTIEVSGTFLDETSGVGATGTISAGAPLRGLIPAVADAQAASGVPVTVVTELARTMLPASGFSAASAVAAITGAASSVIGVTSYSQAMLPPAFNSQGQTSDAVTLKLTALAHVIHQQGAGADLPAKLRNIAAQLAAGSAVNAVFPQSVVTSAVAAVNTVGGASGVVPAGTTPPSIPSFSPPSVSLGNAISAGSGGGGAIAPTPTITGFNPTTGAVGTTVTVSGTNLVSGFPPAPTFKFGTTNAGGPYTNVSNTGITFTVPAGLAAGTHTITVGGMSGTPVTVGTFNVTAPVATGPSAPTNVTAATFSATQVDLTWTAVTGATSYNVYRSTATGFAVGAASKINTAPITGTTFSNTGLFGATQYFYIVTAVNSSGESIGSAEVTATTSAIPVGVTLPTVAYDPQQNYNLQLAVFGTVLNPPLAGQIRVYSGAGAASDNINIYRSTSPNVSISPANLITPIPLNTKTVSGAGTWWFSFDDSGLAAGTKYYYRTTLVNAAGEGPGSTEIVGRTPLATIGAGAGLTLSAAFKGKTTFPNVIPYEYSYTPAQIGSYFSDAPSRGFTVSYQFDAINGDLLEFGLIDTVGGTDNMQMDVASTLKKCAITTATGYTACSALGVTFDRAAGSITFANTPMKVTTGATIGSVFTINGTLNFTPY